jgi:hypothetical protein
VMAALRSAMRILMETLREIFDENAYARFLARQGTRPSRKSYGDFLRENEATRARRPRCC